MVNVKAEQSVQAALIALEEQAQKDLVLVQFTRSNAPYNAGEIAGFDPKFAAKLVKEKVAIYQVDAIKEEKANARAEAKQAKKADKSIDVRRAQVAAALANKSTGEGAE